MNRNINKNIGEEITEELLSKALGLYDEGKPVPDILSMFPDQKEELSRIFDSIKVLKTQKEAVVAPKELLKKIVSAVPYVTAVKDDRYSFGGDRLKSSVPASQPFDILKTFTMKKMYVGIVALLLVIVVAGISSRHRGGNDVTVNLPVKEVNKLAADQEVLGKDITELEAMAADEEFLGSIDEDMAGISEEQTESNSNVSPTGNKTGKPVNVAYLDDLEKDFGSEITSFTGDSQDLEGISGDTSLNVMDSDLGGI